MFKDWLVQLAHLLHLVCWCKWHGIIYTINTCRPVLSLAYRRLYSVLIWCPNTFDTTFIFETCSYASLKLFGERCWSVKIKSSKNVRDNITHILSERDIHNSLLLIIIYHNTFSLTVYNIIQTLIQLAVR